MVQYVYACIYVIVCVSMFVWVFNNYYVDSVFLHVFVCVRYWLLKFTLFVCIAIYIHIYINMRTHTHIHIYIYIYMYGTRLKFVFVFVLLTYLSTSTPRQRSPGHFWTSPSVLKCKSEKHAILTAPSGFSPKPTVHSYQPESPQPHTQKTNYATRTLAQEFLAIG